MVSYRLTAVALDALCLSAERQEGGNVTHSLDYLPGTAVRGAFAATPAGVGLRTNDYSTFLGLFERGHAVFEPLRPAFGDTEGFPVPCSARACKTEGGFTRAHGLQDYLLAPDGISAQCGQDECRSPLVRAPGWYGVSAGQDSFPISVARPTGLHNEIEDETGVTREGILFALQEIEAGTQFIGYVRLFDGMEAHFQACINGNPVLRVGRDRGRVRITGATLLNGGHEPYQSKGTFDQRWAAQFSQGMADQFTLTLLSDALLRDGYGASTAP